MDYIHRMPFVLGAIMTIVVGIISSHYDAGQQNTYLRMAISMVVFFAIGVYIKNTIINIHKEVKRKKAESVIDDLNDSHGKEGQKTSAKKEPVVTESFIEDEAEEQSDIDDYGEDFSPLTVSEIINTKSEE